MREPCPIASAPRCSGALLLCLALFSAVAHAVTVQEIPSPRPAGWSVDLTGQVPRATLAEIDRLGDSVRVKNGAELAVVVVGTTSGVPSHAFATDLFNSWHIGQRKDDGVLVFVALDDHRIEIILGEGLSSPAQKEASAAILQLEMVPRLRQGDPGGAVLAGARAAARDLFNVPRNVPRNSAIEAPAPSPATAALPSSPSSAGHAEDQPPAPLSPAANPTVAPPVASRDSGSWIAVLVEILFLCVVGGVGGVAYWYSRRPRLCPQCRAPLEHLSPEAAAAALPLTPIQQTEARLRSVTIEVYRCSGCGALDSVRHPQAFSRYSPCPECTAVAFLTTRRTLRSATYDFEGLIETESRCLHCSYHATFNAPTPRLGRSTASDPMEFGSFSSSSSSSSSTSSDSGFSGGSSSGDGASGSW